MTIEQLSSSDNQMTTLESRLAVRVRFDGYGRLYGGLVALCLAMPFLPPFEDVTVDDVTSEYGSLWDMAGRSGGGPARVAVLLLFALIAFLVAGAFRPCTRAAPAGVAVTAAIIVAMLLTKPGTGTPTPDLTDAGAADMALAVSATAIAIVHVWHLALRGKAA
jgi:hypothetical protein